MHSFVLGVSILALSHSTLGNPIPDDFSPDSDFFSEDTGAYNDFETPSPMPIDFTPQTLEFSNPTFQQPFENSWLADSSGYPPDNPQSFADSSTSPLDTSLQDEFSESPDDTQFFTDSSTSPLETSSLAHFSDALLESSCGAADDESQALSKRGDGGICTPKGGDDTLPLLKWPDLDTLEEMLGTGQDSRLKSRMTDIPPTPGYTNEDDNLCPWPRRRLCCQGPIAVSLMRGLIVNNCRGTAFYFLLFPSFSFFLFFPSFMRRASSPKPDPSRNKHDANVDLENPLDMGPWPCQARYDACCARYVVSATLPPSLTPTSPLLVYTIQ